MAEKKITELVDEASGGLPEGNVGLELYHSEFVKEGKDWFLRVYIDTDGSRQKPICFHR